MQHCLVDAKRERGVVAFSRGGSGGRWAVGGGLSRLDGATQPTLC